MRIRRCSVRIVNAIKKSERSVCLTLPFSSHSWPWEENSSVRHTGKMSKGTEEETATS